MKTLIKVAVVFISVVFFTIGAIIATKCYQKHERIDWAAVKETLNKEHTERIGLGFIFFESDQDLSVSEIS